MKTSGSISFAFILACSLVLVSPNHATASDSKTANATKNMGRTAGKNIVRPLVTMYQLGTAYKECAHLSGAEAAGCTGANFVETQVNEVVEMAVNTKDFYDTVAEPAAKKFWEENGDDIKAGAAKAAETAGNWFLDFLNWSLKKLSD